MSVPFLLEIGTEEIPDWMIEPALDDLQRLFRGVLLERTSCDRRRAARLDATPRRLVLRADGAHRAAGRQRRTSRSAGPPLKTASRPARRWVRQETGRRRRGARDDRRRPRASTSPAAQKIAGRATPRHPGRGAAGPDPRDLVARRRCTGPGKGGPRFIRPIRWMVALLGERSGPVRARGRAVGQRDRGPPPAGRAASSQSRIENYEEQLRENGVILVREHAPREDRGRRSRRSCWAAGLTLKDDAGC